MFSASKTGAVSSGYQIANSLRFRSSASAYLSRTFGTPTNTYKFTFSFWMKRGLLSGYTGMTLLGSNTYPNYIDIKIDANNSGGNDLGFVYGGATAYGGYTSAVFRDPSAWYHIVYSFDTTQATDSNRVKIYVNGVQQVSLNTASGCSSTFPPQNTTNAINSASMVNEIGAVNLTGSNTRYFDGYLADINFIDGQALTPSSFGQFDAITGVWTPARYTGSYGTNGFHLNFSNGTSTTTLGYDSSGNSNNWTTNNISLTAGSTYDWMIDSPTKYPGSSYGVGNYAVANPLDKGSDITASDGNLSISWGGVNGHSIRDSIAMSAGQWYCELTMGTSSVTMGLIAQNISGVGSSSGWPGSSTFGVSGSYGYANNGNKYTNSTSTAYGASYTTGDVIGIAFDATAGTLTFYKNGSSQGTAFTGISGAYCFAIGYFGGSTGGTPAYANFGQRPFAYTPPSGYKSLCTQNLPAVSIANGAGYMAATLYTGTYSNQNIVNAYNSVSFQPDFIWIKNRSVGPTYHALQDTVRGTLKMLESNSTNAETTYTQTVTGVTSTGFTLGDNSDGYSVNQSGYNYVAWQWKANGTAVTNTAGSITSSVSANTTSGFSVVTFTTNSTSGTATIGHGLGVAPNMIILKDRSYTYNWDVYHSGIANCQNGRLVLNTTDAYSTANQPWAGVAPTSSVFSFNQSFYARSGDNLVAYCFAAIPGYSAFGSYTGNGSSDGPFVYCGFRPRYVLIKRTDAASAQGWYAFDTTRSPSNSMIAELFPNLSSAEVTGVAGSDIDGLSNGFKLRGSWQDYNASGGTYIYAAFAENPFQNALAR